jgi:acetamidase/formamidase
MREWLGNSDPTRGLDRQQTYALCSRAVDLLIAQTVDVPSMLVTASSARHILKDHEVVMNDE